MIICCLLSTAVDSLAFVSYPRFVQGLLTGGVDRLRASIACTTRLFRAWPSLWDTETRFQSPSASICYREANDSRQEAVKAAWGGDLARFRVFPRARRGAARFLI